MYHDEWLENSSTYADFMEVLAKHRKTQRFETVRMKDLKMISRESSNLLENIPEEIVKDTELHTGLYFMLPDGQVIPARYWAILNLGNTKDLKERFMSKQTPEELAVIFNNNIFPKCGEKEERKLFIEDDKVSATMSKQYASLPAEEVYAEAQFFLDETFPEADFVEGMFTHDLIVASWDLSAHEAEFLEVTDGLPYKPYLTVSTSDAGECSVTIRPYACTARTILPVAPIRVPHRGNVDACAEEVTTAFGKSYAMIKKGIEDLEALKKVIIEYPEETMKRIAQANKLPKEHTLEAISTFIGIHGDGPATAYSCFTALCDIIQMDRKESKLQSFNTEDRLCRCMADNWSSYDKPGKANW